MQMVAKTSFQVSDSVSYVYKTKSLMGRVVSCLVGSEKDNIYWSKYEPKNFGDWITPYLFTKITGKIPYYQPPSKRMQTIFGAGSIFRHIRESRSAVVWGSGIISKADRFEQPKTVLAVRGKWTKRALVDRGFSCPDKFGDPGTLLSAVYRPANIRKRYQLGIIPHFRELDQVVSDWAGSSDEIIVIDPTLPIERVADLICSCECTVSSSLHGIIVSHSYGVKSAWVRFGEKWNHATEGDDIKYFDYYSNFDLDEEITMADNCSRNRCSISQLVRISKESVLPELDKCVEGLRESCPFK